jgi:hypothetical protein
MDGTSSVSWGVGFGISLAWAVALTGEVHLVAE